jgi:hypothetical protein
MENNVNDNIFSHLSRNFMKTLILVETLRESCKWLDEKDCKHTNTIPSPKCKSLCVDKHGDGTEALLAFVKKCPLTKD